MGIHAEERERTKAAAALIGLGCAPPAALITDHLVRRAVHSILHAHMHSKSVRRFNFGTLKRGSNELGAAYFLTCLRGGLCVDRLPAGVGSQAVAWAAEWQEVVAARHARRLVRTPEAARVALIEEATSRRVRRALETWGLERRLVRAVGDTDYRINCGQLPRLRCSVQLASSWSPSLTAEGQLKIDARIEVDVPRNWYGRVERRGLAIVDGAFVLDARSVGESFGGHDPPDGCLVARAAVPGEGFSVRLAYLGIRLEPRPHIVEELT
jgi:hypothetical protein